MLTAIVGLWCVLGQTGPRIPFPFTLEAVIDEAKKGVDIRSPEGPGKIWFAQALAKAKPDIVQYFLDHGWSAKSELTTGETPLYTLCYHNGESVPTLPRLNCLRMLLDKGADPNFRSKEGQTAIGCLVSSLQDPFPLVRVLLKRGARIDIPDNQGQTPFIRAMYSRGYQLDNKPFWANAEVMAMLLLNAGANPRDEVRRSWGWTTPLHIAASKGMAHLVGLIVNRTHEPNLLDSEGQNALFMAAIQPDDRTWNALIQAGANPRLKDGKGDTAAAFRARWLKLHPRRHSKP